MAGVTVMHLFFSRMKQRSHMACWDLLMMADRELGHAWTGVSGNCRLKTRPSPTFSDSHRCLLLSLLVVISPMPNFGNGGKYHSLEYEIWVSVCVSRGLKDISSQKGKT